MGRQAILSAMVVCCLLMYTSMEWSPSAFIASTTKGQYQYPFASRLAIIPVICRAAWWWNPPRTSSISPVTSQLLIPYKSTECSTALYIDLRACTVAPVLYSTLANISHRLWYLRRFYIPPPNCCYCRKSSALGMEKPLTVVVSPHDLKQYLACLEAALKGFLSETSSPPCLHFYDA